MAWRIVYTSIKLLLLGIRTYVDLHSMSVRKQDPRGITDLCHIMKQEFLWSAIKSDFQT